MAYQTPLTIKDTLENIAQTRYVLPAIQRELVWAQEPERMCRLFDSILRGYPIGTFLFWKVSAEQSREFHFYEFMLDWHERKHRHNDRAHIGEARDLVAILDGQQRLSALNIGLYGSLAHKLPRKRVDSVDAYPSKRLYLDLRYEPGEDDDFEYGFAFLSDAQISAASPSTHHWYRVGEILDMDEPYEKVIDYVTENDLPKSAARVLSRLWAAVHQDGVVSYFEVKEPRLDKVLDIFVRVNSGGVVLTKSDLLLSIATAQFTGRDAREEIHGLVDDLNDTKPGFKFSKDLVLKSGLVLTDISDVGFAVENFTAANMTILDTGWDDVDLALRIAVKLLSSFGFSDASMPAASLLIPIADYVHQRALDESYVTSAKPSVRADRAAVRHWALRTILKPGIWGSGLDQVLRSLHQVIRDSEGGFPVQGLELELAKRGKSLAFDDALIDELLDTPYKHKRVFALLTLLYDWVDVRNEFHVDHVFPRSLFTSAKLRDHGVRVEDAEEFADRGERLPNLQLLPGPENVQKRAQLPADWIRSHLPEEAGRQAWLVGHGLYGIPPDLLDFLDFYDERRAAMRELLLKRLGMSVSELAAREADGPAPAPTPSLTVAPTPPKAEAAQPRPVRSLRPGATKRRFGEAIADVMAAGRLATGDILHARHRGNRYEVAVMDDGRLRAGPEVFDSPSQAARFLSNQRAVNGWVFWLTEDDTPIAELRRS